MADLHILDFNYYKKKRQLPLAFFFCIPSH